MCSYNGGDNNGDDGDDDGDAEFSYLSRTLSQCLHCISVSSSTVCCPEMSSFLT